MDFYPLNREPQLQDSSWHWKRSKVARGVAALAVVTTGALNISADINSASLTHYESATKVDVADDGIFTIVDSNIAANAAFAIHLMQKYNADIGVFQETQREDAQNIVDGVAGSSGSFAAGDYIVDMLQGGLGNMTVAQTKPHHDEMRQFAGDVHVGDFLQAMIQLDARGMSEAYQERRAAFVGRYNTTVSGHEIPVNIMNVHIAGDRKAGEQQRRQVIEYAQQELTSEKYINIISGDLNQPLDKIRQLFPEEDGWVVAEIGRTSRSHDQQIDHFIYREQVVIDGIAYVVRVKTKVLPDEGSDHNAILGQVELAPWHMS